MMLDVFKAWLSADYWVAPWQNILRAPDLTWFHSLGNVLLALADFSVPFTLLFLSRRRSTVSWQWPVFVVAAFFASCGTLHLMEMRATGRSTFALPASLATALAAGALVISVLLCRVRHGAVALANRHVQIPPPPVWGDGFPRRRRKETSLRAWDTLGEGSGDAMVGVTIDGLIAGWNAAAERLYGYTADEVLGQPMSLFVPLAGGEDFSAIFDRLGEGRPIDPYETVRLRKDGHPVEVSLSVLPIKDSSGRIVGAWTLARDITEAKHRERALQKKLETLENASRAKDRFLAVVSHELRTPLNAILGYTGALLMKLPGPLTVEQEQQLRIMQSSSRHLVSLLNELLDLARIESGKMEIRPERVVCQWVLEEAAAALRPLAEGKGLPFYVRAPVEEVVTVTDRRALHQILLNLCHNAIKFTDRGAVRLRLDVRIAHDRAIAEFSVADTGIGIQHADQNRLFEAFAQMRVVQNERQIGSGLGLHLSQKLAALLGGKISFQSQAGKGSVFKLLLPLSPETCNISSVNLCRLESLSSKTTQLIPS